MVGNVIAEDAWAYANANDIDCQDSLGRLTKKRAIDLKNWVHTLSFFLSTYCFWWGVRDTSGSAAPFLDFYRAKSGKTDLDTFTKRTWQLLPPSCMGILDIELFTKI